MEDAEGKRSAPNAPGNPVGSRNPPLRRGGRRGSAFFSQRLRPVGPCPNGFTPALARLNVSSASMATVTMVIVLFAGCLGGSAPLAIEDFLPQPGEVPSDLVPVPNPGANMASIGFALEHYRGDERPLESTQAVFNGTSGPTQSVVVVAMRFPSEVKRADWLPPSDADGWEAIFRICGGKPWYGFVKDDVTVVIIAGSQREDVTGASYLAALDLEKTLRTRVGGTSLCTDRELASVRGTHTPKSAMADSFEPNDDRETATRIPLNPEDNRIMYPSLVPAGDVDWYVFSTAGGLGSWMVLPMKSDVELNVTIFDESGTAAANGRTDKVVYEQLLLNAGTYHLRVAAEFRDAVVPEYYFSFTPPVAGEEPNDDPLQAFVVESNSQGNYELQATLIPTTDTDWFSFAIAEGGNFSFVIGLSNGFGRLPIPAVAAFYQQDGQTAIRPNQKGGYELTAGTFLVRISATEPGLYAYSLHLDLQRNPT